MKPEKSNSLYLFFVAISIIVFVCLMFDSRSAEATDCGINWFYYKAYDNRAVKGWPKSTGCTYQINLDLRGTPPELLPGGKSDSGIETDFSAIGVGSKNFSIYWKGVFEFQRGFYVFFAAADDGIRVIFDGQLIIDDWRDHPYLEYHHERYVEEGLHTIEIYYYQHGGGAHIEYNHHRK